MGSRHVSDFTLFVSLIAKGSIVAFAELGPNHRRAPACQIADGKTGPFPRTPRCTSGPVLVTE